MKDFIGNELNVGDEVVFMEISYRTLKRGTITKITPQKVKINPINNTNPIFEIYQFSNQVVKICK